jgi:hypothetical protein
MKLGTKANSMLLLEGDLVKSTRSSSDENE